VSARTVAIVRENPSARTGVVAVSEICRRRFSSQSSSTLSVASLSVTSAAVPSVAVPFCTM
jgi:hypothetical protein